MSLEARRGAKLADPGAELLDRVGGFWSRFGGIATGAAGVVAVVAAIAFFSLRARAAQEEQAASKLAEANLVFWQGDYARSLQMAKQVSEQFPSTPSGIDAHRLAGDDSFWSGDFKNAIAEYRKFLEHLQRGMLADAVRRSLAYAYESDGQFAQALPLYDGLVGAFDRESSAEFLMAGARCQRNLEKPAEAAKRLQRLLDEFGETSQAMSAREELAAVQSAAR